MIFLASILVPSPSWVLGWGPLLFSLLRANRGFCPTPAVDTLAVSFHRRIGLRYDSHPMRLFSPSGVNLCQALGVRRQTPLHHSILGRIERNIPPTTSVRRGHGSTVKGVQTRTTRTGTATFFSGVELCSKDHSVNALVADTRSDTRHFTTTCRASTAR